MVRNDKKKVMLTLMMLVMVVVAQGQAVAPAIDFQPNTSTKKCSLRCGLECAIMLSEPPTFALCFGLCMLKCKITPEQLVYNCTSICAKSAVDSDPKAGQETVRRYVDKCYEGCKNNM